MQKENRSKRISKDRKADLRASMVMNQISIMKTTRRSKPSRRNIRCHAWLGLSNLVKTPTGDVEST